MDETTGPEFSIIIPSYNYAHYLPRAVESTLIQGFEDFETIVVDDGSTDSTAQVVEEYCARTGGKVRYVSQSNQGPGAARNKGISLSRGRFLLFLDSDDVLLPDALRLFRSAFLQGFWVDFVWGAVRNRLPDGTIVSQSPGSITSDKGENFRRHLKDCLKMKIGAVAVRRRICERVQFPISNRGFEHVVFHGHLLALHTGVTIADSVLDNFAHQGSLYRDLEWTKLRRFETVPLLFDPAVLPPECMPLQTEYVRGLWLSLFHDFKGGLRAEDIEIARAHRIAVPRLLELAALPETGVLKADRAVARACFSLFRVLCRLGYCHEANLVYRFAVRAGATRGVPVAEYAKVPMAPCEGIA